MPSRPQPAIDEAATTPSQVRASRAHIAALVAGIADEERRDHLRIALNDAHLRLLFAQVLGEARQVAEERQACIRLLRRAAAARQDEPADQAVDEAA